MLPLKCANVQYHQTICSKSHLAQFSTFQNIGKHENKEKLFELNGALFVFLYDFALILKIHSVCNSFRTLLTQS